MKIGLTLIIIGFAFMLCSTPFIAHNILLVMAGEDTRALLIAQLLQVVILGGLPVWYGQRRYIKAKQNRGRQN